MSQEDKELLLKDLSARLPYKCKYKASKGITHWHKLTLSTGTINKIIDDYYDEIKPYLRPMSSMTEEECEEYRKFSYYGAAGVRPYTHGDFVAVPSFEKMDWLNAHHFDYRGLIERRLAIDCTDLNIY